MTPLLVAATILVGLILLPVSWFAGQRIGGAIYRLPAGTSLAVRISAVAGTLVLTLGSAIAHSVNYRAGAEFDIWLVVTWVAFFCCLTSMSACLARGD